MGRSDPLPTHLSDASQKTRAGLRKLSRPGKYLVVGGTGAAVNSGGLVVLHQLLLLPLVLASVLAVEISIGSNYLLNDRWTFGRRWPSWRRFLKFNLVSCGGLVITTAILWALVTDLHSPYLLANACGIVVATAWNFAVNLLWTWRRI
jgi:dolichol-phosphate mannosyltransferase